MALSVDLFLHSEMYILACLVQSLGLSFKIHGKQVEMEEAMVKEIFHQVLFRTAGVCSFIGMLSSCRCSWCLESFAGGGTSWYWSKVSAGKSTLVLANGLCLDRMEMSFKNYPLHQCYW